MLKGSQSLASPFKKLSNLLAKDCQDFRNNVFIIDPMHKWRLFKYSFVYIQISPTSLSLGNIFF